MGTNADNIADRVRKGRSSGGSLPGIKQPNAKLSEGQVRRIRKLVVDGMSQEKVGLRFGIAQSHVSNIVSGKSWGHLS